MNPVLATHVRSDTPSTAYTGTSPLWVKGTAPEAITYLVFDVPDGAVKSTVLNLTAVANVVGAWAIYDCPVVDAAVTYTTRPTLGVKLADVSGVSAGAQSITLPAAKNGRVCLALAKTGGAVFKFTAESLDVTVDPVIRGPQPWPSPRITVSEPIGANNGVYVDATAAAGGTGAEASPFRTITEAVAAAAPGAVIVPRATGPYRETVTLKNGLHGLIAHPADLEAGRRPVIDGEAKRQWGLDTRPATSGVLVDNIEVTRARNQGCLFGQKTHARSLLIHDIFADWSSRAPLIGPDGKEDANMSGVKITGTGGIMEDCQIRHVGQHSEARGILMTAARGWKILRNHVMFARKEGIRDAYGGLDNEIAYNTFVGCWAAASVETTMGTRLHHNVLQDCTHALWVKHTAATQDAAGRDPFPAGTQRPVPAAEDPSLNRWLIAEYNTLLRLMDTAVNLHANPPWGDFVCFRRNLLAGAMRRMVFTTQDPAVRGPNLIQDENAYVMDLPGWSPPDLLFNGDGQGSDPAWKATTLPELQAEHSDIETHGVSVAFADVPFADYDGGDYNVAPGTPYGAQDAPPLPVKWEMRDPVAVTVSHTLRDFMPARLHDHMNIPGWSAGNGVDTGVWVQLDFGSEVTFTHLLNHPSTLGDNSAPRSLTLQVAGADLVWRDVQAIVFNDTSICVFLWPVGAQKARYVRFQNIVDFAGDKGQHTTTGVQTGELGVGNVSLLGHPDTQVI